MTEKRAVRSQQGDEIDFFVNTHLVGIAKREYFGHEYLGHWVLRDQYGQYLDDDVYSNDLIERFKAGVYEL